MGNDPPRLTIKSKAILIASSVTANPTQGIFSRKRNKVDSDLVGPIEDVASLYTFCVNETGISVEQMFSNVESPTKAAIIQSIIQLFSQNLDKYIIYYSGHGMKPKHKYLNCLASPESNDQKSNYHSESINIALVL